jgi:hypothetical protein
MVHCMYCLRHQSWLHKPKGQRQGQRPCRAGKEESVPAGAYHTGRLVYGAGVPEAAIFY